MSVTVNLRMVQVLDGTRSCVLTVKTDAEIAHLQAFCDSFEPGKEYAAVLGEKRKKRSMDANAYAWVLLDKLAVALSKTDRPVSAVELYRDYIRDVPGASDIVMLHEAAVEEMRRIWESRGIGWQAELVDGSALPGYCILKLYKGSSEYDTRQMKRLLDLIIDDCKELGIQTMTPAEMAKLKGLVEDGQA